MNFNPFIDLAVAALNICKYILIARVIISWLLVFNILSHNNRFVNMIVNACYTLTEPLLRRVRNILPNLGRIDISVIIVFLLINFIQSALVTYFYAMHL